MYSIVILIRSSKNNKTWKTNFFSMLSFRHSLAWMDPEGVQGFGSSPPHPEKSQVAIGFLRNTGMDPLKKQLCQNIKLDPLASNCLSREVHTSLREIRPGYKTFFMLISAEHEI